MSCWHPRNKIAEKQKDREKYFLPVGSDAVSELVGNHQKKALPRAKSISPRFLFLLQHGSLFHLKRQPCFKLHHFFIWASHEDKKS
jgi:hypothetical protein